MLNKVNEVHNEPLRLTGLLWNRRMLEKVETFPKKGYRPWWFHIWTRWLKVMRTEKSGIEATGEAPPVEEDGKSHWLSHRTAEPEKAAKPSAAPGYSCRNVTHDVLLHL